MDDQKPILDYSSPAQERAREQSAEDARRQAIENYNESTFGQPHPIASALSGFVLLTTVVVASFILLPSRIAEPLSYAAVLGSALREARQNDWRPQKSFRDSFPRW